MKVLAVNWMDREHPQAGGAEIHFFELFGRLAARGHEITLVCSGWRGGPPDGVVQGITVRRVGGRHSFALKGRGAVRRALAEGRYEVVVEDVNKLPLFLPTVTDLPMYVVVPHLFGATAFREASWPVAAVVWLAERPLPRVYRRAAFHAISTSTRDDLVRRGVAPEAVRVIFPGVDAAWYTPDDAVRRADAPTFLYVGRLKRYKGVDTALRALALARARGHEVRLDIAGDGDERPRLEQLAARLGVGGATRFLGYVNETDKRELFRRAWAVVFPSAKEGWGMTNVEAAACGTPAIAADSPGLRESVRHGETGVLVPFGDPEPLAAAMQRFAEGPAAVQTYGRAARRFAEQFSWDAAAAATEAHLADTVRLHAGRKE